MAWRGSLSRSFVSTARASGFRSSPPLSAPSRLRHYPLSVPRRQSGRLPFSNPRGAGMHAVIDAAALHDRSAADFSLGCQCAGFL